MSIRKMFSVAGLTLLAVCAMSAGSAQAQTQTFAYVTNAGDDTVSVINPVDGSIVATIPVGDQPYGIAATPDGTRVYVANSLSSTVSVIDTVTNTVVTTIWDGVGPFPRGIAITPDGAKAYVANHSGGSVSVIDIATNTVTGTIGAGSGPSNIAFTPETPPRAYVTNTFSANLTVIDTATDIVLVPGLYIGGGQPEGIAIDADGIAYIANRQNGVNVVDTSVNSWQFFPLSGRNTGVAVSDKRVYVTNNGHGLLQVGDFSGPSPTWNTLTIGPQPVGVTLMPDESQAWVANSAEYAPPGDPGHIATVDNTATPPVIVGSPIPAGAQPTWIAFATLDTSGSGPETFELDLALRRIKILQRGRHKDYFWVDGKLTLDPESDGLNLPEEESSIIIGPTTFDIPAGSFISLAGGRLLYFKGMVDDTWLRVILLESRGVNRYRLAVFGKKGEFPGIANPVTVSLMLGNDSGEATKRAWIH
jgi:YVTN family beta-propeller protein